MNALVIVNDQPYGSERPYNALRLATTLSKREAEVRVFLMGDAVACAMEELADWTIWADQVLTF